jgi:putative toxin-antitoxin system antitoxin component (TIGR02293 family)
MSQSFAIGSQTQAHRNDVVALFGGARLFSGPVNSSLDAHRLILEGFSNRALANLVGRITVMQQPEMMEKALGLSYRTYLRRQEDGATKPLSQDQSGRLWKFAEVFATAMRVLGSLGAAEAWLSQPAIGLDNQRPIDLLATIAGVEIVEDYLERLEYGVYT